MDNLKVWKRIPRKDHRGFDNSHTYFQPKNQRLSIPSTVASSIYSQPYASVQKDSFNPYDYDISPPDSRGSGARESGNVSPIESDIHQGLPLDLHQNLNRDLHHDIHPAYRISSQPVSKISIARKAIAKPTSLVPRASFKRDLSQPTKWDKYSGEPTSSERGMPHGVRPDNIITGIEQLKLRKTSAPEKSNTSPGGFESRTPWKGASGRSPVIAPVHDTITKVASTPIAQPLPRRGLNVASPILTSPLYQDPRDSMIVDSSSDQKLTYISTDTATQNYAVQPPSENPQSELRKSDGTFIKRRKSTASQEAQFNNQESVSRSRFSWTTQATNTTYQHSPPSSPPPPLPTINVEQHHTRQSSKATTVDSPISPSNEVSMMSRARPITSGANKGYSPEAPYPSSPDSPNSPTSPTASVVSIARKPIGIRTSCNTDEIKRLGSKKSSHSDIGVVGSIVSGKALPPTPQQLSSVDHISLLQAQIDDLMTQRRNVERVIRDLTGPGASNPLTTNFRVEREREKRIQAHREELNEIALQEHKFGLKLHRAQKKKEEVEGYEGFSTLWVRRVAS